MKQRSWDERDTLADRLRRAVARLEEKRDALHSWQGYERERLNGKIEGVKLAASYMEDDERIFGQRSRDGISTDG